MYGEPMDRKLIILSVLIVSGCTGINNNRSGILDTLKNNEARYKESQIEITNQDSSVNPKFLWNKAEDCKDENCPFFNEKKHLQTWPPEKGLALSGGGTRSASFSIGVLKALHESGILKDINIISGVSGGAYATYWYFSQNYYLEKLQKPTTEYTATDLFRTKNQYLLSQDTPSQTNLDSANGYRFQKALEESSDIMAFRHDDSLWTPVKTKLQLAFELLFQGLSTPFYWVSNGLFDWEMNINPFFYFYKDGLDRTYGLVPLDYSMEHFANATSDNIFGVRNIDAEPILMDDFKTFFDEHPKHPYFIVNATGVLDAKLNKPKYDVNSTANRVFEFTPWGCRSRIMGVNKNSGQCKEFRINHPFGADQNLDLARMVAISGAAVDGKVQPVDVDGHASTSSTWLELFLDLAHLNLGYHLDNPNTPTIHKVIHKLLPWPLYLIDDHYSDENSASGIYLSDGGHSENLAVLPLIRRGVKVIYLVDAEQDGLSVFQSAKRLNNQLQEYSYELCFNQEYPLEVLNTNNSIFDASVKAKGQCKKTTNAEVISMIHYIKLSAPPRQNLTSETPSIKLPYTVTSYMEQNPKFPHQSTVDIFYSPEQFMAYRDLGYKLTLCKFPPEHHPDTCLKPEHSQKLPQ
jgi:hypothetical protein